jgi:hypothetical protein
MLTYLPVHPATQAMVALPEQQRDERMNLHRHTSFQVPRYPLLSNLRGGHDGACPGLKIPGRLRARPLFGPKEGGGKQMRDRRESWPSSSGKPLLFKDPKSWGRLGVGRQLQVRNMSSARNAHALCSKVVEGGRIGGTHTCPSGHGHSP